VKESTTGKKFVSLKVEAQGQKAEAKTATPEAKNDDMPF